MVLLAIDRTSNKIHTSAQDSEQGTIILGSLPAEVMKLSSLEGSYQEKSPFL